jgi:transcriptional regulator with XRE-family HTH domain
MKKKNRKEKSNNELLDLLNESFPEELTSGKIIRAKRKNYGITLEEVEKASGISQSNLSLYENDKKSIGLTQATKIGMVIGLHPMSILFPNGIGTDPRFKEVALKGEKLLKKKIPLEKSAS